MTKPDTQATHPAPVSPVMRRVYRDAARVFQIEVDGMAYVVAAASAWEALRHALSGDSEWDADGGEVLVTALRGDAEIELVPADHLTNEEARARLPQHWTFTETADDNRLVVTATAAEWAAWASEEVVLEGGCIISTAEI